MRSITVSATTEAEARAQATILLEDNEIISSIVKQKAFTYIVYVVDGRLADYLGGRS